MFFHLLYIHLFRPFLQYTKETSPLPDSVNPRKLCTTAASMISKLMRLYKRSYGLRQICNICVYIVHSACTIHLLNLPDKGAKRDIVHGVKHLEEIAEGWLCARRSLGMIAVLARKWKAELPEDAVAVLERTNRKFGAYDAPSPGTSMHRSETMPSLDANVSQQQSGDGDAVGVSHGQTVVNGLPASIPATTSAAQQQGYAQQSARESFGISAFNANGLQSQQYPSSHHFPPASMAPGYQHDHATTVASPSDMFGGVEQLLHESNDWTYRDQAQLATGFENWTGVDVSPVVWRSGNVSGSMAPSAQGFVAGGGPGPGPASGVIPTAEQFQRMHGGFVPGYDEEEWYQ